MIRVIRKKDIEIYTAKDGKKPFIEWLESLKDKQSKYRIKERLDRVALGNMGDYKSLDNGVMEMRFTFGSGYRIYYGEEGEKVILLLCGGDKSSQKKDIQKAHLFWDDYLKR